MLWRVVQPTLVPLIAGFAFVYVIHAGLELAGIQFLHLSLCNLMLIRGFYSEVHPGLPMLSALCSMLRLIVLTIFSRLAGGDISLTGSRTGNGLFAWTDMGLGV